MFLYEQKVSVCVCVCVFDMRGCRTDFISQNKESFLPTDRGRGSFKDAN